MVAGLPAIRSRRGPQRRRPAKLRANNSYDADQHRRWLRDRDLRRGGRPVTMFLRMLARLGDVLHGGECSDRKLNDNLGG